MYDEFRSKAKTKVDGTLNLYRVFASSEIAFLLSLSSVSDVVDSSAQASYNAGNALQSALARQNKKQLEIRIS